MNIYDFNEYELSEKNGSYGGNAGLKEGIIFNDENWLLKYPKSTKGMRGPLDSYTTSPLSEYIGSKIYKILGYDVHEVELGIKNNKIVVACKDFIKENEELREIRQLKNTYNEELAQRLEENLSSTGDTHVVDLNEILIHFKHNPILSKVEGIEERFWDCIVIDGFINNNDRNNGNWGLIYRDRNYTLAPIFDNGAAFNNKLPDSILEKRLKNLTSFFEAMDTTKTIYGFDGESIIYNDILNLDFEKLKESILKNNQFIKKNLKNIIKLIQDIPNEINGINIISDIRKEYYIQSLNYKSKIIDEKANEIIHELNNSKDKKEYDYER